MSTILSTALPDLLGVAASFVWMSAAGGTGASPAELGVGAATAALALGARTGFGFVRSWLADVADAARPSRANRVGPYTLGEMIGQGGMGEVYRARHALMDREVAIKVLPLENSDDESRARFEREALLTSRLSSPNTVAVHDYGRTADGRSYYVMEHVEGQNLEDLVAKFGPLSPGRVIHLVRQAAAALGEAHARGLVHRDVKPANLAICERAGVKDVVKVLDFGLALESDKASAEAADGRLIGTPAYLAPEAIRTPGEVDGRTDVYALGAVAYWLLTGTPVFDGNSIVEICSHHLHTRPDSLSERLGHEEIPSDLEAVVLRCLAKAPADRYASMAELADALDQCDAADDWSADLAAEWWRATAPVSAEPTSAIAFARTEHASRTDRASASRRPEVAAPAPWLALA